MIIPTWNEERWLPRLLNSLDGHSAVTEIIVADNASTDRTRDIAKQFGCRVVDGGRPAEGRNLGAAASHGDRFLFVDADVVPTAAALRRLSAPTIDDVVYFRVLPIADAPFVRACYATADAWFVALRAIGIQHGLTNFLLVARPVFERINGFDERLDPGEDVDFVRRAARVAQVAYERAAPVFVSARRFFTEPAVLFAAKTVFWEALRLAETRKNPLRYRWPRYEVSLADSEAEWLMKRERHLHE